MQQIGVQLLGIVTVFVWCFALGYAIYWLLKKLTKLRVSPENELIGLNISEHGARSSLLDTINAMNEIAAEKIDLTHKLNTDPWEDTAEINQAVNKLLTKIDHLVKQLKEQTNHVNTSSDHVLNLSGQLKMNSDHQSKSVNHTFDFFQNAQQRMNKEMKTDHQLIDTLQESYTKVNRISNEMLTMKTQMNDMAVYIENVEQMLDQVHSSIQQLVSTMSSISEFSGKSKNVIKTITDISMQINLLSLNASIEATRAGEHGAGFAVVAQKVKNLAEESRLSAEQIRTILDYTSGMIESGQTNIEQFTHSFGQFNEELTLIPQKIKHSAREMELMYHEMDSFMEQMEQMREDTQTMQVGRSRQQEEFEHVLNRMNEMLSKINENQLFSTQINGNMTELKNQSSFLDKIVKQFKTEQEGY